MLCAIQEQSNEKVIARAVAKSDGPFLCPICRKQLTLRKGQIKAHHFAHKPPVTCLYGLGESEAHRWAKWSLYDALSQHPDVTECELEKNFGNVVSDVYAVIRGTPVALEIQISNLALDEIVYRTEAYCSMNIPVLWLPLFSDKLEKKKYSPKVWEKWLHTAGYGRIYYWLANLTIIPIHFDEYELDVEGSEWYDEYGDYQYTSSYTKRSKRWRTPLKGKQINIVHDLIIQRRKPRTIGKMHIPKSMLLVDQQTRWWRKTRIIF